MASIALCFPWYLYRYVARVGAAIVDWIAYGHAVQSAKDKSQFGQGDIRGVIAPETANNAHKAGALIPTVAFGIPGSIGTAILLSALVIKGLRPGPDMLTTNLDLTFSMVWAIVLANLAAAALLMFFGVLGYWMKQGGWPRPPLILALVLGGLMENNFHLTRQIYGDYEWLFNRPIVVVIEVLILLTVVLAVRGRLSPKADDSSEVGEGAAYNPLISMPLAIGLFAMFAIAYQVTLGFQETATAQFPNIILLTALPLSAWILLRDGLAVKSVMASAGGLSSAWRAASSKAELRRSFWFIGFVLAVIVLTYLFGQLIALPVFVAAYLRIWGDCKWTTILLYAGVVLLLVWGFYGQLMRLLFHPSIFFG